MILPDYPIENSDADKLRRAPLAVKVAELIKSFKGKESFVIGIEGIWGSGKTSFINLALNGLRGNTNTIIVHFNPWNFAGQNELIADFFATLYSAIKDEEGTRDLTKTLRSYASKLQISFKPSVTLFGTGISLGEVWGKKEKTLQEERKSIDKRLKKLTKKIVIIVDDIDRLDAEETQLIMKLVKMTANFPNTVFLLAYDRDQVAEKLGNKNIGEEYLKKIIQVSFTLPQPDELGLRKILFADLDNTIEDIYGKVELEGENEKRWGSIVYAGFPNLFLTIRDIKRYISSLRLNWSIVGKNEVNIVDFIAIEAIRVIAPQFYSAISSNKSLFTETDSLSPSLRGKGKEARQEQYKELLEKIQEDVRDTVDKICKELFPQIGTMGYGHEWQQLWRKEQRICATERFPFYFQLGVPEGAVSETEIENVITMIKKGAFKDSVLDFSADDRLRPMLSKLLDYLDKLSEKQAKDFIITLWSLEQDIVDERRGGFDIDDVETQMMRLAYHSIKNCVPKSKRGAFLKDIAQNSTTLYPPTHFISILKQEHEKSSKSVEGRLVSEKDLNKPEAILLKRIKESAKENKLADEEHFAFFLYRWKKWENENAPKKYVKDLIKTTGGIVALLKGFMGKVYSSNGNYYRIDRKGLFQLIPQSTLDSLVEKITDEELKNMGDNEKKAVELYKNPPKDDNWG